MSKHSDKDVSNPTNQESSGANKTGIANSGQNQFPLKKDAQEAASKNKQKEGMPSAGSRMGEGTEFDNSGNPDRNK